MRIHGDISIYVGVAQLLTSLFFPSVDKLFHPFRIIRTEIGWKIARCWCYVSEVFSKSVHCLHKGLVGTSSQFPLGAPKYEFTRVKSSFDLGPVGPSSVSCFAFFGAFFRSVCTLIYAGSDRELRLEHLEGHNPMGV